MPYLTVYMHELVEKPGIIKILNPYTHMIKTFLKKVKRAPHSINMAIDATKEHDGETILQIYSTT